MSFFGGILNTVGNVAGDLIGATAPYVIPKPLLNIGGAALTSVVGNNPISNAINPTAAPPQNTGYIPSVPPPPPQYATAPTSNPTSPNPWAGIAVNDSNTAATAITGAQNNLATQAAAYPSFPNAAGAGSQLALSPANAPSISAPMSVGSQGANPWSFQGEANSR